MIKWIRAKEQKPKDNQMCWITFENASAILGPIPYKDDRASPGWIDLFATPEAGTFYSAAADLDMRWCAESEINEPEYDDEE